MKSYTEEQFNSVFEAEKSSAQNIMNLKMRLRMALNDMDQEVKKLLVDLDAAGSQEAKSIREALIEFGVWS
jgi:hypothetical protein